MKRTVMNAYDIIIEHGLLDQCGQRIASVAHGTKCAVITDNNVAPLYSDRVIGSLKAAGFQTALHQFPHGEENKTIASVLDMVDFLAQNGLTRSDTVIALGGGVVGDMAGFAASIYLRGIDFVQIPTTLLAQIDSSVGGKTGCDLPIGKNLAGAFHNPALVLIDPDTLQTLPERYRIDGMGEAIKYGCIGSIKLFEMLEHPDTMSWDDIIAQCVGMKADIVERDFQEQGERALLNFGHTLGHAIEKLQNFRGMSHGCAVSVGMNLIARACERHHLCPDGTAQRLEALCRQYQLPTSVDLPIEQICRAAYRDKKRKDDTIGLVVLKNIGRCDIMPVACDRLAQWVEE